MGVRRSAFGVRRSAFGVILVRVKTSQDLVFTTYLQYVVIFQNERLY